MTGRTDLLDAVDALTLPQRRREQQDIIRDRHVVGQQSVQIVHAPLLEQLADAIAGAVGAGKSKGSTAFERNALDFDALYRFMKIDETIRQWCVRLDIRYGKDPAANLRTWYAATLALKLEPERIAFYVDALNGWAASITSKLDPWRIRDLPDACPACGADTWWDKKDGTEYARPLVVQYKPLGADLIQHARGMCRACETVWGVRELAYEIEVEDTDSHREVA